MLLLEHKFHTYGWICQVFTDCGHSPVRPEKSSDNLDPSLPACQLIQSDRRLGLMLCYYNFPYTQDRFNVRYRALLSAPKQHDSMLLVKSIFRFSDPIVKRFYTLTHSLLSSSMHYHLPDLTPQASYKHSGSLDRCLHSP